MVISLCKDTICKRLAILISVLVVVVFFLINYNVPIVLESLVMIADIWLMLMYKQ